MKIIYVHCSEEMGQAILTAMNTSELVVEMRPGKKKYILFIFPVIIHHLEGLFGSNIMTSSQLAC